MREQFYITLPSNSSMQFFPDNRTCCYITQLPRAIELLGEWEVGLAEIHYPLTFSPISKSEISRNTAVGPVNLTRIPACQMFVYCDLVEPRIVGDVYAPLLRVIQACGKPNSIRGESEMKTLSPPHYFPLMLTNFRTIEINIRDHTGKAVPFETGTLTVTLHFKRVR